jgi:ribonuclease G
MNKELVVSSNRHETRVAILEDERLVELYFERANEYSLVGSIHKGRVTRVLPGMQSAFVDIGLERDAFLYVSDFFEESDEYEPVTAPEEKAVRVQAAPKPAAPAPAAPERAAPEAEPRDRKNRRSRRRRGRGRPIPESKFAPQAGVRPEAPPAAEPQTEAGREEFPVLPGESLAKYRWRRSASFSWPAPLEPEEDEQPVGEEASAAEPSEELQEAAAAAVEVGELTEQQEEAVGAPLEQEEGPESASAGPEAEELEEEEEEEEAEEEQEEHADEEEEDEDEEEEEEEAEADDEDGRLAIEALGAPGLESAPPAAEEAEEAAGGAEPEEPEVELAPEVRLETEAIGERAQEEVELEEEAEEEAGEAEEEESREAAAPPAPGLRAASAEVRELEPRYLHRPGRRGRRRGRSGQPDLRPRSDVAAAEAPPRAEAPPAREKSPLPSITELLKEGQEIIVQIAKEPLGQKGARITSHIALPGRYVVYMPTLDHLGVSRKIASDEERQRLRRILQTHRTGMPGGFIMRTAGEGRSEEEIAADMNFLFNLWLEIRKKAEKKPAPALLHHDLQVVERVLRDQVTSDFKTIWVDSEDAYESILQFLQRFQPNLLPRVRLYTRATPIFDAFNITAELERALRPKVWLKSGGYIVINQTEALVAIDINTGKFVGGKSNRLEDTIVKTNLEAVSEIVRQIRLRDLGGIIVVDFIDMEERKNRQKVMQALEEAMRADRAPYKILQFNDFGLVAITRKRVKQSLERTLCSPCPYCEGAGYVKSVTTIIGEILVEAKKLAPALEGDSVMLRVHPDVAKEIKSSRENYLEELEEILGRPVLVTADPLLHHEKFDLA